jgi:hypothetical protein
MSSPFALLVVVFALTGGTALLAEQAFEELLSTVVGASTPASAIVLAVTARAKFEPPSCEPAVRAAAPGACDVTPDDYRRVHGLR